MDMTVERVDVWAAAMQDEPGGLAGKLTGLRDAGADLDFVIARRAPDKPGTGVVFVTPLKGEKEMAAAAELGFNVTESLHSVRVEGDNRPGAGADLTAKLAAAGVNMRGFSAAVMGTRYILYIAFDNNEDATKAISLMKE